MPTTMTSLDRAAAKTPMGLAQQQLRRFQNLLRDLFEFNSADLDFGIYRIINHKRDVIDTFIATDLPHRIEVELTKEQDERDLRATAELKDVIEDIQTHLGSDVLDPDGHVNPEFSNFPLVTKYQRLKDETSSTVGKDQQAVQVFNHLYSFFSRYYQDGDFVSKRRYSKQERYSIPYSGQEIYLYWANRDQYYIKTGESFKNYTFRVGDATILFALVEAMVEQNNVKGKKRYFFPLPEDIVFDESRHAVTIPFSYRSLTQKEEQSYGTRNQQNIIIEESMPALSDRLSSTDWSTAALKSRSVGLKESSHATALEHHLHRYTRKNSSDFFIHKDLRSFLLRELDFYLKNEVISLEDLAALDQTRGTNASKIVRIVHSIASPIIDFLHQIETFQKLLWEKRKFIINQQYCISIRCIDKKYYPVIAHCEPQWAEWETLLHVSGNHTDIINPSDRIIENRVQIMMNNQSMMIDSKFYPDEFIDALLQEFGDIDAMTDGHLFHGDNFQVLKLITERYRHTVDLIYIDPPYNSKSSEILYKNSYKHSSWLSLMDSRLSISRTLLRPEGTMIVAIDENEQENLGQLLRTHFTRHDIVCVSIVHNKKGIQGRHFSYNHDFAYFCMPECIPAINGRTLKESDWHYDNLRKWGRESERHTAKNCFYPIMVKDNGILGFGDVCDDGYHPPSSNLRDPSDSETTIVFPVDAKGTERKWRYARSSIESIRPLLRVHRTTGGEIQIQKAKNKSQFKTVWDDNRYIAGDYGTKWLTDLGLKLNEDLFPKSIHTVQDSIAAISPDDAIVLDYFAGSGTTGHAVINLNRETAGSARKFILAEMGEYFTSITLPRIKKVSYCPEWKNGRPRRSPGAIDVARAPRLIKYSRIESYEDSLNNISFEQSQLQHAIEFDDYSLSYMLQWESRHSTALLDVQLMNRPFNYALLVEVDSLRTQTLADLPETFNLLAGLRVRTRRVLYDGSVRYLVYRGYIDQRCVAVIWRTTANWSRAEFERDQAFVLENDLTDGVDEVLVNGDSFIPGAKSLDALFKSRMFGES